MMIDALLGYS